MLINPDIKTDSCITWICDKCEATLNEQPGFNELCGKWKCTECGFVNKIAPEEVYVSEDEYQADIHNPYKGLSDKDALELSLFEDEGPINGRNDIVQIRDTEYGRHYVKKLLTTYDRSIYDYLMEHPIDHMPRICGVYESINCLIVIEEYVEGKTLADLMMNDGLVMPLEPSEAIRIAKSICEILNCIHNLPTPIVHRDIKPSNVMITPKGEVFLLDMNVAKWYDPEKNDDTRYMGTQYYAAPEQVGYGLSASSDKSDIYALGMLMNVMLTGKFPKEEKAAGKAWNIIEKCISLDANMRYDTYELKSALEGLIV
ncbi:MAG: protein kinase [Lachnospiraceae bacterium]|nr:protein kinase [Lachnospiraceae bacterium]